MVVFLIVLACLLSAIGLLPLGVIVFVVAMLIWNADSPPLFPTDKDRR
jgi:hypothetical protein